MQGREFDLFDERAGLCRALHRLSSELHRLASENQLVQQSIAVAFEHVVDPKMADLTALQHLDIMHQTLVGLAQFTDRLSQLAPSDCTVDPRVACAGIVLSALVDRLSEAAPLPNVVVAAPTGEYEPFEACEPTAAG